MMLYLCKTFCCPCWHVSAIYNEKGKIQGRAALLIHMSIVCLAGCRTQDAGVPPPVNSTQQPIGQPIVKQAAPAPIRPSNTGSTGPRSMADLFKQTPVSGQQKVGPPPIPIPKAAPTAPAPASSAVPAAAAHTPNTPQLANPAGHLDSEDTNGWGPDTADQVKSLSDLRSQIASHYNTEDSKQSGSIG